MAFVNTRKRRRTDVTERAAPVADALGGALPALLPSVLKALTVVAVSVALVVGARMGLGWARTSPAFQIHTLAFHGLHHATEAELTRLSGMALGQNLFAIDPEQLAQAMNAHPWVRKVEISRHFPRVVSIQVQEHEPVAMAVLADLYLLDAEGEPFKKVTPEDALNLPLVTGMTREQYMSDPVATAARFRSALELVTAYQRRPSFSGERVSEVRLEKEGMAVVTGDGQDVTIGLGGAGSMEEKLERLVRVRGELSRRGLAAAAIRLDNRTRPGWVTVQLESSALRTESGSKRH